MGVPFSMLGAIILRIRFMVRETSRMQDSFKVCNFIVERKIWCSIGIRWLGRTKSAIFRIHTRIAPKKEGFKRMKYKKMKKALAAALAAAMTVGAATPMNVQAAAYDGHTMYMVGNAHIDTAWQWPYEDTARDILKDTMGREIKALKEDPNRKFTMSASKHYEWVKEYYPEMYEDIKKFMENGQWDNPGGQVVEPDLNVPSGESLVRQSLEGQHFFEKEFGKTSTVGYVPDTFGFSGQFPQILEKSGMTNFVTTKLNWQNDGNNGANERKSDVFLWNGIDGKSRVLSYAPSRDYVADYNDGEMRQAFARNKQQGAETNVKIALGMFGNGDHGGGPDGNGYNRYVNKTVDGADVKIATITEFFNDLKKEDLTNVREVDGEMYFENHRGTYTSWGQVKKYNRKNEILAEKAEKAAAVGNWLNAMPDADAANLNKAWDRILINQFHDVLPGSSIPYAYMDTYNDQELAERLMENTLNSGMDSMAYVADTQVEGTPILVFNALSWNRNEMVEADVRFEESVPANLAVYDGAEKLMTTVLKRDDEHKTAKIRFYAKDIPAVGYKVFSVGADKGENVASSLSVSDTGNDIVMENENLKVEINKETGNIRQIYNKKDNNRKAFVDGTGSELHVLKDTGGSNYPAWDLIRSEMNAAPAGILNEAQSVKVVEESTQRVAVHVTKKWKNSVLIQDFILDANSDKVDVDMEVDWKENNQMLKVAFPIAAEADMANYEMAYGSLQRPTTRDTELDARKFEVSGHKWADITDNDGSHGVSILNDSKYGWDALKQEDGSTRLRLSALRSPIGASVRCSGWDPKEYYIDKTHHEFSYSVYPHASDWKAADTVQKGYEFNYGVDAKQALKHEGTLGGTHSFASAQSDSNNVQLTVMKTPTDDAGAKNKLVLRTYESEGKDGSRVTLTLPSKVTSAKEVNLLEHNDSKLNKNIEINGNMISYTVDKYEITTVEVALDGSGLEQVELSSKPADLSKFYNVDGTSPDANREEGNFDGKGNTIPEALWESTITYNGAKFQMGPGAGSDKNFVKAEGQRIRLPGGKYDAIYVLGAAAGDGKTSGEFTVYQDGETVSKELSFADWQANLSGWDRFSNVFVAPEVRDQIAHVFTHFHNGTIDRMTVDNYQYVYKINVNSEKELESILLPEASGIKIAAITAVRSDLLAGSFDNDAAADLLEPVTNLKAEEAENALNMVYLTWDAPAGVERVRIYRGETADFEANAQSCVGISIADENSYFDKINGRGRYFYKAIGVDAKGNQTPVSEASNGISTGSVNIALQIPKENVTAIHAMNDSEAAYRATDGDEGTKWCGEDSTGTKQPVWLQVDLGETASYHVKGFSVHSAGNEQASYIAQDFVIQGSQDGSQWTDVVSVQGNDLKERDLLLKDSVSYRYYRLWLTQAVQDNAANSQIDKNIARIYEFKIWGQESAVDMPVVRDLALTAAPSKENPNESIYEASYKFVPMSEEDSDAKTKIEWFKNVGGEMTALDHTEKIITLANEEAFAWESLTVRITPVASNGAEGEALEKTFVLSGGASLDAQNNIENSVLTDKPVTTNLQVNSNESGAQMVDGSFTSKWCAEHIDEQNPGEAVIDMRGIYELSKLQLFHSTYAYDNSIPGYHPSDNRQDYNTRAYQVSISDDGKEWTEIASYDSDDGANKSEHDCEPGAAVGRYLKLVVTKAGQYNEQGNPVDPNSALRIPEIKAAGKLLSLLPEEEKEQPEAMIYGVNVTPLNAEMTRGASLQFHVLVEGTYNPSQDVVWSVEGGVKAGTAIDENGLLTVAADELANELTVCAVSVQDNEKSDTVTVKLTPELVADYAKVDDAIEKANAIDRTKYTEQSLAKLDEAVNAVVRGLDSTKQDEINAMAKAIEDALAALEEKQPENADYSKVDEAIGKAQAVDRTKYTEQSLAKLDGAVNAVVRGLDSTKQNEVNAMAKAIEDALAALEEKQPDKDKGMSKLYFVDKSNKNMDKMYLKAGSTGSLSLQSEPKDAWTKYKDEISWKSSKPSVATVDANGTVKGIKTGATTITAVWKGDSSVYAKCVVTVTELKLQKTKFDITAGSSAQITVKSIYPKGDKVSYTSSNTKVAKVNASGKITAVKAGKAVITVKSGSGIQVKCQVNVKKVVATKKLSVQKKKLTLSKGTKASIKVKRTPANASDKLTWKSSNKRVATVNSKGQVVAKKAGKAVITVKSASGKKATCTIQVAVVKLAKSSATIKKGATVAIKVKSSTVKNDKAVSYKSSNKKVATVNKKGIVKGKSAGNAEIVVKMKSGATAVFKVKVKK